MEKVTGKVTSWTKLGIFLQCCHKVIVRNILVKRTAGTTSNFDEVLDELVERFRVLYVTHGTRLRLIEVCGNRAGTGYDRWNRTYKRLVNHVQTLQSVVAELNLGWTVDMSPSNMALLLSLRELAAGKLNPNQHDTVLRQFLHLLATQPVYKGNNRPEGTVVTHPNLHLSQAIKAARHAAKLSAKPEASLDAKICDVLDPAPQQVAAPKPAKATVTPSKLAAQLTRFATSIAHVYEAQRDVCGRTVPSLYSIDDCLSWNASKRKWVMTFNTPYEQTAVVLTAGLGQIDELEAEFRAVLDTDLALEQAANIQLAEQTRKEALKEKAAKKLEATIAAFAKSNNISIEEAKAMMLQS